ncbi:MAG: trypsin-like peptidase domain-containing protein [Clostridia bacterium]|nr:trypsin-like peptidase domain-containing protein [Clostridia bacterium]
MESKKVNIFAFIMIIVMCAVSIYIGVGKSNNSNVDIQDDVLTIYKKLDDMDEKIDNSQGKSAYQIAVDGGYEGTEGEWLLSLKGTNGTNVLTPISLMDIYNAYLEETNQTSADMDYDEFLVYYYSVVDKHDTKTATQLAYSTTVDICYSYTNTTVSLESGTVGSEPAYKINESGSGKKGGVSAGAGVIYKMLDTNTDSKLDTAYIITNYHVAYIENYSNDPNYVVYYNSNNQTYFLGTEVAEEDLYEGTESSFWGSTTYEYFLEKSIDILTVDEGISKHFLTGVNDEYYGIYLYGYQNEEYKINASFVGGSADNDIAVLKIERNNISNNLASILFDSGYYNEVSLGYSTDLVGGEEVIAVGNPLLPNTSSGMKVKDYEKAYIEALVLSSTTGVVSAITDDVLFQSLIDSTKATEMRLIRVDAAINSGNSGGGLYDLYGKLVGIVNSKIASSSYDNVGYAIPINIAVGIANQVIEQCEGVNPISENTRIKRLESSGLGFDIENGESKSKLITNSTGQKEWKVSYNVLVKNIKETSTAYFNGLRNDDIITSISFDGITYKAESFFNTNYELRDLLLNVKLSTTKITLNISNANGSSVIEIPITVGNFVEIS